MPAKRSRAPSMRSRCATTPSTSVMPPTAGKAPLTVVARALAAGSARVGSTRAHAPKLAIVTNTDEQRMCDAIGLRATVPGVASENKSSVRLLARLPTMCPRAAGA